MTRSRTWAVVFIVAVLVVIAVVAGTGGGPNTPLEQRAEGTPVTGGVRGVSASTATLLAGVFAGGFALLGVLLGLFGDRYLRHRGDILFRSGGWDLTYTLRNLWDPEKIDTVPFNRSIVTNERVMARAEYGNYFCNVKLFNQTEVATGLRDVEVVFVDDSGTPLIANVPQAVDSRNFAVDPDVINLPARQWVNARYYGRIGPEEFEAVVQSTRVEMRAYLPGDKPFVQEISRLWE